MNPTPQQARELLHEINSNHRHPANDNKHPMHRKCRQAINQLLKQIEAMEIVAPANR